VLQGTMAEILNRCGLIALKSVTHLFDRFAKSLQSHISVV